PPRVPIGQRSRAPSDRRVRGIWYCERIRTGSPTWSGSPWPANGDGRGLSHERVGFQFTVVVPTARRGGGTRGGLRGRPALTSQAHHEVHQSGAARTRRAAQSEPAAACARRVARGVVVAADLRARGADRRAEGAAQSGHG